MMVGQLAANAEAAPRGWKQPSSQTDSRLHQLAPYIGKLKPVIARQLLRRYTAPGDIVLDCFSGSGTIPLEAVLLGRRVLAFDANPYAVTLTRAKLEAPASLEAANEQLMQRLVDAEARRRYASAEVPEWVRKFFHPETLQNALRFADECLEKDDQFLLACLLRHSAPPATRVLVLPEQPPRTVSPRPKVPPPRIPGDVYRANTCPAPRGQASAYL